MLTTTIEVNLRRSARQRCSRRSSLMPTCRESGATTTLRFKWGIKPCIEGGPPLTGRKIEVLHVNCKYLVTTSPSLRLRPASKRECAPSSPHTLSVSTHARSAPPPYTLALLPAAGALLWRQRWLAVPLLPAGGRNHP